ncbi:MAG: DinB family protein [Gemmatimonadota bacterium]
MRVRFRHLALALVTAAASAAPAGAQQAVFMSDLTRDANQVRDKLVALAKAIPQDKYDWRPAPGVRSVGEVFLHLASDNYLLPSVFGVDPDPATGIKADDFKTLTAYEKRRLTREEIVAEVQKSFVHLEKAMQGMPAAKLGDSYPIFGQSMTGQRVWILTVTHLHEHLGQQIAYARSNGVVPPWSQ